MELTPHAQQVLEHWARHACFIRYSSMISDGRLRTPLNTRVNGNGVVLIPYGAEHIPSVHMVMQFPNVHVNFGIAAPSLEDVSDMDVKMWC